MDFPTLHDQPVFAIDTETTGTQYPKDKPFMISISTLEKDYAWDLRQQPEVIQYINDELRYFKGEIAAHYASFDTRMLSTIGIELPLERVRCTVVRACIINEHESTVFPWTRSRPEGYSLDALGSKYLQIRKDERFYDEARDYFGDARMSKDRIMSRIAELPTELVQRYARQDTRVTLELFLWQNEEIERQELHNIIEFEESVFPELVRAEMRGIHVDVDAAAAAQPALTEEINILQRQLNDVAGFDINVNSTPQIRKLFDPKWDATAGVWIANDGTPVETTDKGQPSFKGDIMHNMSHPAASLITSIRSLIKTRDVFLGKHVIEHAWQGVVYPTINQAKGDEGGTGTGRLSYTDPAMQQIPARNKKIASIVKPCFLPPEGMVWVETDLASFEVRVFAHLVAAYNDSLVRAYAKQPSLDFHQWVGDMTGLPRNATYSGQPNAKQLNLSMIFNQGRGATAAKMGMPWEWDQFTDKTGKVIRYQKAGPEAHKIIDLYHSRVQGVKDLADRAKSVAEQREYVRTRVGRKLRFPKGYKSYKASGLLIQATAADVNKRNWIKCGEAMGKNGHLILNTHDSYSMAMDPDWRPVFKRVKEAIEDTTDIKFRVPLILDLDGAGKNWWSAKNGEQK
ncbi:MAG: DNA polymerase [Podoviridae sp. ctpVR23]|nr:MAG: DNA polymerase [Podoviridae sp. ctpVR23]